MGETFRNPAFFPRHAMIRRATLQRLCPQGKQRRPRTPAAPLARQGKAASPNAPQAAGPCSWACRRLLPPPPHPNRNAARPPPARGAGARLHGAEGTGSRHCRRGPGGGAACPCGGKAASLNAPLCRRQAPAPEPAAVCSYCRPIRNATQRARPLLVGRARVSMAPTALAAGTAGPAYMTWRIMHFRYFVSGAAGRMG